MAGSQTAVVSATSLKPAFAPADSGARIVVLGAITSLLALIVPPSPGAHGATAPASSSTFIMRTAAGRAAAVARSVQAAGGIVERQLDALDEIVVRLPGNIARGATHIDGVISVTANTHLTMTADGYDPASDPGSFTTTAKVIGAREAYEAGWRGDGVDVALIDSGIAPVAGLNGQNKVVNGPDLSFESQDANLQYLDTFGHGTHLAGIIAGRDADPASADFFQGVAPGARLVNIKVADAHGNTDVSQVLAAIDWVVQHRTDNGLNIRVLNLSFGTDSSQSASVDPLSHAVEVAWSKGLVVVVAAGNGGTAAGHLANPAIDPFVLAVGADDPHGTVGVNDDTIPAFSSRGDGVRNPSLVAPGQSLISLRDPGSYIDSQHPEGRVGSRYFRGSGTSQAAAVASGAAALVIQAHPNYSPDEVKAALNRSARSLPNAGPTTAQGRGLISVVGAIRAGVSAAAQSHARSTGAGSLEASRGSVHLSMDGVDLTGEQDIFGHSYDSATQAMLRDSLSAWDGGVWNGSSWSGSSWSGSSWSGSSWSGSSWSGSSWSGSSWSGSSWSGNVWSGASWYGTGWQGSSWSITSLAADAWATDTWQ